MPPHHLHQIISNIPDDWRTATDLVIVGGNFNWISMVFDGQTSPFRWNFGLKKFKFITYFCVAIKPREWKMIFNYGKEIQGHKPKDRLESHPWFLRMWRTILALIHFTRCNKNIKTMQCTDIHCLSCFRYYNPLYFNWMKPINIDLCFNKSFYKINFWLVQSLFSLL